MATADKIPPVGSSLPGRLRAWGVRRLHACRERLFAEDAGNVLPEAWDFQDDLDQIAAERPSRLLKSAHYLAAAFLLSILVVSALVDVDMVVVGTGRLATDSPPIVLQPIERAIIRELKVKAGDVVTKGQVLARLDPTFAQADMTSMSSQKRALLAQIGRVQAELAGRSFETRNDTSDESLQSVLYQQRQAQYKSKLLSLDEELRRLGSEIRTTEEDRTVLAHQLEVARNVEDIRNTLLQSGNGSKLLYLDALNQRLHTERDFRDAANHLDELGHSQQAKQAERQTFIDEWRRQLLEELLRAKNELIHVDEGLAKAVRVHDLIVIQAPEDGVVLEVAKRSEGSVMREAEPLVTLLPSHVAMIADITISSGDVGYIKEDNPVVIKMDAFPFQRHGTLEGHLRSISQASFMGPATGNPEGLNAPAGGTGGGYHIARVELSGTQLRNMPEGAHLIPGMTLNAEINVGTRSVLSFFVFPLTRALQESLRGP